MSAIGSGPAIYSKTKQVRLSLHYLNMARPTNLLSNTYFIILIIVELKMCFVYNTLFIERLLIKVFVNFEIDHLNVYLYLS